MSDSPLVAHSLAEAYLFLMATPCSACGQGPLRGAGGTEVEPDKPELHVALAVTCGHCKDESSLTFRLPHGTGTGAPDTPARVNPTSEPSQIIDLGQWLTLFRTIAGAAEHEHDKTQARHLGLEAAQCLDEALKFYHDEGNDLPEDDAFWHETSHQRFQDHPEQFARSRLLALRARLPSVAAMTAVLDPTEKPKKRRWFRRG